MDDDLYALDPAEFTAARDALAKRLKAEGDKVAATEVKSLRRPTAAAWAVNQVARRHPELVEAVVDAGRRLVAAQETLLAGGGRDELRAATAARRDAVAAAATKAAVALAGDAHRDAVHATFDAAATDEDAADAVRGGRLAKELDPPSSFALLGDFTAPPEAEPAASPSGEPEVDPAAVAEAEARAQAARAAVDAARRRRDEAARALDEASAAVEPAERAATEAEAALRALTGR